MSDPAEDFKQLSLRVVINKDFTKVLFAEANSNFTDILLSFLTLPLGRIVKLMEKHYARAPVFGSITSLYKGIANLDNAHFTSSAAKLMLLNPKSSLDSKCCKLKLDISESHPYTNVFICDNSPCPRIPPQTILMYHDVTAMCLCSRALDKLHFLFGSEGDEDAAGVFTVDTPSFIVYDDLRMVPYSTGFISALTNLGLTDAEADRAELRDVKLGIDEVMNLLKCCLFSNTPLSDVILRKGEISSRATPEVGPGGYFSHQIIIKGQESSNSNYKKTILKVMVQKSTNKVLFAQAEDDFVELLCSFLIIPTGGVESLLHTDTCLKNLDNLYGSISDVTVDKYFITPDTKKKLMNPDIPLFCKPKNTFPRLNEEMIPDQIYYGYKPVHSAKRELTFSRSKMLSFAPLVCKYMSPWGKQQNYVKVATTYMVTDDLTVTPFCMSQSFSILNRLKIPLSDVHELEVPVGLQEGLNILKASLTSSSALTEGLMERILLNKEE